MRGITLALLLFTPPAFAQGADCLARPVGPEVQVDARPALPNSKRGTAQVTLGPQPLYGTRCVISAPPSTDVLRGPAPGGDLLRGDPPPP